MTNPPIVRFTPDETLDLSDVRKMTYDEANQQVRITYKNGDTDIYGLSSGGQRIWDAYLPYTFLIVEE